MATYELLVLTGFALLALSRRYTTQKGRLITVIRRDGGAYYLSLAGASSAIHTYGFAASAL